MKLNSKGEGWLHLRFGRVPVRRRLEGSLEEQRTLGGCQAGRWPSRRQRPVAPTRVVGHHHCRLGDQDEPKAGSGACRPTGEMG